MIALPNVEQLLCLADEIHDLQELCQTQRRALDIYTAAVAAYVLDRGGPIPLPSGDYTDLLALAHQGALVLTYGFGDPSRDLDVYCEDTKASLRSRSQLPGSEAAPAVDYPF